MTQLCGPFLNMALLTELFDTYNKASVWRWNTAKGGKGKNGLPPPDLVVGGVSLWTVDTITGWAESTGRTLNTDVLARVLSDQTTRVLE